jgi:hypothetical protein
MSSLRVQCVDGGRKTRRGVVEQVVSCECCPGVVRSWEDEVSVAGREAEEHEGRRSLRKTRREQ